MNELSTIQVARLAGISKNTLLSWLHAGKIPEPKRQNNGGQDVRLWSDHDVAGVSKYKEANYRKGRGRKKKKA
jgi:predicted site-specific integrase-resolvase